MAVIYVDPENGTDNGDAGRGETDGTSAYASQSYALANYGSFSTTSGNTIYLADTAADVITTSLNYDGTVAKAEHPLAVIGYHYDGSNGGNAGTLTVTLPWGVTISGGQMTGSSVSYLSDVNTGFVTFKNLKLHGTSGNVLWLYLGSSCINCEIYDGGNTWLTYGGTYTNCKIYGDSANGTIIQAAVGVRYCEISGGDEGINVAAVSAVIAHNTIHDFDDSGIVIGSDYVEVCNNTIDGAGGDATAIGIEAASTTWEDSYVYNNLVTNFDGASQKGIYFPTGSGPTVLGNNGFYNNFDDVDSVAAAVAMDDIQELTNPYPGIVDDFSLRLGALSIGAATQGTNGDPLNPGNIGAWQGRHTEDRFIGTGGGLANEHLNILNRLP